MEHPLDMRIRRTYRALTDALLEMMEKMPFEDIRVKDLCERAMLRKSTFYKHFADKYELLSFVIRQTMEQYDAQLAVVRPEETPTEYYARWLDGVFAFLGSNEKLVYSALKSENVMLIVSILAEQVTPRLKQKLEEDEKNGHRLPASPQVTASFFAGAVAENLKIWLAQKKRMPEETLKEQLCGIINAVYRAENETHAG